jgi:hypothetical protein
MLQVLEKDNEVNAKIAAKVTNDLVRNNQHLSQRIPP